MARSAEAPFSLLNRCQRDPSQPHPRRRCWPRSSASLRAPSATQPARSRRRRGALAPATRRAYEGDWLLFATWCAHRSLTAIPAAPATVAAFLAAEADRGFRPVTIGRRAAAIARRAPRPGPSEPVRFGRGRRGDVGDPSRAWHQPAPKGRAAGARPPGASDLTDRHHDTHRATGPGAVAGRVRRGDETLRAGRPGRRGPVLRRGARAQGHDPQVQDRPGPGRSHRGGAVRARGKHYVRGQGAAGLARRRGHLSRAGVSADASRRHRRRAAPLRPVGRADRQTPDPARGAPSRAAVRATRCVPGTRPRPRARVSRSARSPTSPATRTFPSCAATSAPRLPSTTSAKCSNTSLPRSPPGAGPLTSPRRAHLLARLFLGQRILFELLLREAETLPDVADVEVIVLGEAFQQIPSFLMRSTRSPKCPHLRSV